jgi:glycosyltransferase involved in cell wall biosynthesis
MPAPRLLIVTEAAVAAEARGASKTLYELFAAYPGPLRVLTCSEAPPDDGLDRVRVPRRILPERLNHLGAAPARARGRADGWLLERGPWLRAAVRGFGPHVVLAVPLGAWGIAAAGAVARHARAPVVAYFMDDWVGTSHGSHADELLRGARGWLMISERLKQDLAARFSIDAPPTMVVHNPARVTSQPRRDRAATGAEGPLRIVYAGSIWPMHLDAIELAADAVGALRTRGREVELVVHTDPQFVAQRAALFARDGVRDGGLLSPQQLVESLLEADLALVACSFAEDQRLMSRSSVQTKLTEYMGAGTPILGVGPTDAASIEFIEHWEVGRCCTKPDVARLADLVDTLSDSGELREISAHARAVARRHFDGDAVRAQLWDFVASRSDAAGPAAQTA